MNVIETINNHTLAFQDNFIFGLDSYLTCNYELDNMVRKGRG